MLASVEVQDPSRPRRHSRAPPLRPSRADVHRPHPRRPPPPRLAPLVLRTRLHSCVAPRPRDFLTLLQLFQKRELSAVGRTTRVEIISTVTKLRARIVAATVRVLVTWEEYAQAALAGARERQVTGSALAGPIARRRGRRRCPNKRRGRRRRERERWRRRRERERRGAGGRRLQPPPRSDPP